MGVERQRKCSQVTPCLPILTVKIHTGNVAVPLVTEVSRCCRGCMTVSINKSSGQISLFLQHCFYFAYVANTTSGDGEPSDKVLNLTPGIILVSPESRNEKVADRRKRIRRHCQNRTNKRRLHFFQSPFCFLF